MVRRIAEARTAERSVARSGILDRMWDCSSVGRVSIRDNATLGLPLVEGLLLFVGVLSRSSLMRKLCSLLAMTLSSMLRMLDMV